LSACDGIGSTAYCVLRNAPKVCNSRFTPHDNRYFDIFLEYAKADQNDILIKITAINRGPETAECHVLPTLWFRNTWSWGYEAGPMGDTPGKPCLRRSKMSLDLDRPAGLAVEDALSQTPPSGGPGGSGGGGDFEAIFAQRQSEADEFYAAVQKAGLSEDEKRVQRQALAGMLWSKQLFYYDIEQWLQGDPAYPPPPASRWCGRNRDWEHLNNFDTVTS
jgi:hypothetical protein